MLKLKRFFIAASFSYIYVLMVLLVQTNQSAVLKGDVQDTKDIYSIDGVDVFNMNTIYVLAYAPLTFFQYSLISFDKDVFIYETTRSEKSLTTLESFQIGQIQKESSYHTALIVAFEKANMSVSYVFKGYAVTSVPNNETDLKINDFIIEINDLILTPETDMTQFISDSTLELKVMRNSELIQVTYERKSNDLSLSVYPMYDIIDTEVKISLQGLNNVIGGPSSGLMMTLSIYASLKNYPELHRFGGTGTLDLFGNVGSIGGLYQKYMTAIDALDYMFVPKQQEALLKDVDTSNVVFVQTIDEAIHFLESLYESK
jgi:PDZ domain-containing protein